MKINGYRADDLLGAGLVTRQRYVIPLWVSLLGAAAKGACPQPVEAISLVRSSAKTSDGFFQPRILRGLPLISRATAQR